MADLYGFYIFGDRPVKFVKTEDGGMDILAYEWESGTFIRDLDYLDRIWYGNDVEEVSEEEFNEYVEKLKKGNE